MAKAGDGSDSEDDFEKWYWDDVQWELDHPEEYEKEMREYEEEMNSFKGTPQAKKPKFDTQMEKLREFVFHKKHHMDHAMRKKMWDMVQEHLKEFPKAVIWHRDLDVKNDVGCTLCWFNGDDVVQVTIDKIKHVGSGSFHVTSNEETHSINKDGTYVVLTKKQFD